MEPLSTNTIYTVSQRKNIILVLLVLVGLIIFKATLPFLTAILSAIILYTLFRPFYLHLIHKRHLSNLSATVIILIMSFLIIVLPLFGLSLMIIDKLIEFQKHPEIVTDIINKLHNYTGASFDIKAMINNSINDISGWAINAFSVFLDSALKIFIALIIIYFTLFYMFRSHEKFEKTILKYLPFNHENSLKFGRELKNITLSNILGQGLIGLCQGIIVAVGFLIFGIPDPVFWGIVSVFVCFLPVVGAPIIFIPAAILELASGNNFSGIGILIWGIVLVTFVDNFLRQFISKKIADTHPLITIIGVIIGIPVFGLIGLVIGPFLISFFILLFKMYERNYLAPQNPGTALIEEIKKD
ncbi:MAG: AI-2E family transporter [Bacteroidota bacterium]